MNVRKISVYKITNIMNGKAYIGKTVKSVKVRFWEHKWDALRGDCDYLLHRAFRKYGVKNFRLETLIQVRDEETAFNLECFYIKKFKSNDPSFGYNMTGGGEGCSGENHPFYGKHHTEESKQKIGMAFVGRRHSNETKRLMSESQLKRFKNKENCTWIGKKHSNETKKKMSESAKRHWKDRLLEVDT